MFVVQPYCNSENLRLTYSEVFFPIADANQDIESVTKIVVKPPKQRRQVGHPKKKKRIRSKGEGKRLKCIGAIDTVIIGGHAKSLIILLLCLSR